ncbi:hypothetical protein IC575_021513 [Cucumis melo]
MDEHELASIVNAFIASQRQLLLMLELLKNDTKRITHIPYETRHRIRQLAYFRMIHGSDLVCRQSTAHPVENAPSTSKEFFNMKHSSARNVIERAFGVLKGRWAILRGKSYYPVEVQCRTILACCLLHNLINREMTNFDIEDNIDEVDSTHATTAADDIHYIETSNEWSQWRDNLAEEMFTEWELRNQ